ncbi:MAG: sensor histidine kinase [Bacillota bacterium]
MFKEQTWKELIQNSKISSLIGIGISLTFMLASNGLPTNIIVWLYFIAFGALVGFFIGTINFLIGLVWAKHLPDTIISTIFKLISIYISSSGVFYLLSKLFHANIKLPADYLLYTSLAVGIPSVMIALFFTFLEEKETKIQLEKENKKLAIMQERNRIARELHDSVSQNLFGISLNLDTLKHSIENNPDQAEKTIEQLKQTIQEVQTEMRLMVYELKPLKFQKLDFFEAIENLINLFHKRYSLLIKSNLTGSENNLDNTTQLHLYRIIQESLNNIIKHADADRVELHLVINNDSLKLTITDDGSGFDVEKINNDTQFGLQNIKERVSEINGQLDINSTIGEGSTIKIKTSKLK